MAAPDRAAELRREILERTRELTRLRTEGAPFEPGRTVIPYAARVYDEEEVAAGVDSMLDFWLTLGPEGEAFERELARFLDARASVLTNSGSSANLLAVSALTSPALGDRALVRGDEVVTAAAAFPTTVNPIVQNGLVPVFVDAIGVVFWLGAGATVLTLVATCFLPGGTPRSATAAASGEALG